MIKYFYIFLIWPLIGFYSAVKNLEKKGSWLFLFLFITFGSITLISNDYADIRLHSQLLEAYENSGLVESFLILIEELSKFSLGNLEIYADLVAFTTSLFNQKVWFSYLIVGVTYFFFWNRLVSDLLIDFRNSIKLNTRFLYVLILIFAFHVAFYRAVNGRYYLAYWVFISSIYQIYIRNNTKWTLGLIISILIHQSFLILIAAVIVNWILEKWHKTRALEIVLYVLFVLGFFVGGSLIPAMRELVGVYSDTLGSHYDAYVGHGSFTRAAERSIVWFRVARLPLLTAPLIFMFVHARRKSRKETNARITKLYYLTLLLAVLVSWGFSIPQFGMRFWTVLTGFILLTTTLYSFSLKITQKKWLLYFLLISDLFYLIVDLKIYSDTISLWIIMPLSILLETIGSNTSLSYFLDVF